MVWKNTRQVLQTAAAPPSRGSTILATIGSTRNIRPALRKRVLANTNNIVAGHKRGTIPAGERALVFIFVDLLYFVVLLSAAHTARQPSRGSLERRFASCTKCSCLRGADNLCHFLVALITSKDLLRSAKALFRSAKD